VNPNAELDTGFDSWDAEWNAFADLEEDLSDILDPDHLESAVMIDDQGRFLDWNESEGKEVALNLPSRDAPLVPHTGSDFIGFTEKSGFGLSATRSSGTLEGLNARFDVESAPLETKGESLGMEEVSDGLNVPTLNLADMLEAPRRDTGFAAPAETHGFLDSSAPAVDVSDLERDMPMLDLMDAIEPRQPKNAVTAPVDAPSLETGLPMESEPDFSEPMVEATTLEAVPLETVQPVPSEPVQPVAVQVPQPTPVLEPIAPVVAPVPMVASAPTPSVVTTLDPVVSSVPVMPAVTTLRRVFDATDLLEAQQKLVDVLAMPRVPLVVFLGRSAQACAEQLKNVQSIALAELRDDGLASVHRVNAHDSFRKLLLEISDSTVDAPADLTVADLSDLELDEVVLPVSAPHLVLTKLEKDAQSGRVLGTLSLSGPVGLRSGAQFLKAVVTRLESPITLML
jgi:hypothetical protein